MRDAGQQTVGHALLVAVTAAGVLLVARVAEVAAAGFESFLRAMP
jgi:hypothetical protein